jgi:hypothetical protein
LASGGFGVLDLPVAPDSSLPATVLVVGEAALFGAGLSGASACLVTSAIGTTDSGSNDAVALSLAGGTPNRSNSFCEGPCTFLRDKLRFDLPHDTEPLGVYQCCQLARPRRHRRAIA